MNIAYLTFHILPPLAAFVFTLAAIPLSKRIAVRIGLVDEPDHRKRHSRLTPCCGGIVIFVGIQLAWAALFVYPHAGEGHIMSWGGLYPFVIPAGLLLLLGVIDDRWDMSPWLKLSGQILAATAAYASGLHFEDVLGITLPEPLDFVATLFWFVGIINAFNLIDGMDGVASGLAVIATLAIGGLLLFNGQIGHALMAISVAAACLAFLYYNFYPASIFMGDAGSMFLGYTVAALSLATSTKTSAMASLIIPLCAVGVPAFDTFLAIWRRTARRLVSSSKDGRIFGADAEHIHHRLRRLGLSQRQVALALYTLALILLVMGMLSVFISQKIFALYLAAFLALVFVVIRHLAHVEFLHTTAAVVNGIRRPSRRVMAVIVYPFIDVAILAFSLLLSGKVVSGTAELRTLLKEFRAAAPLWIGLPFIFMALAGTYRRVWSRARVSDYAAIYFSFSAGTLLAAILENLFYPSERNIWLHMLAFWSLAGTPLLASRALLRLIQDGSALVRRHYSRFNKNRQRNVLLYGAGYNCTLFLRAQSFELITPDRTEYRVAGLIDDDSKLHGRLVHGLEVVGGIERLGQVLGAGDIDEIVVTTQLLDANRRQLCSLAQDSDVLLRTWRIRLYDGLYDEPSFPSLSGAAATVKKEN